MKKEDPRNCPTCEKQALLYIIKEVEKERINTACPECSMVHNEFNGWVFYPFFKK